METSILKHRFHLGKIDARGTGRKVNEVTVDLRLTKHGGDPTFTMNRDGTRNYTGRKTPEYTELSICADAWNSAHTDIVMGGQCLDEIARQRNQMTPANRKTFDRLYLLWTDWHLNGMHAGTPEQEAAVKEWKAAGNRYDYTAACDMLKERELYEIPFTGKTVGQEYHGELYKYGHGWVVVDLPEEVIAECKALVEQD